MTSFVIITHKTLSGSSFVGYDLDDTIIKNTGKKFDVNRNSYEIRMAPEEDEYIIITNQKGIKTPEQLLLWKEKAKEILERIDKPALIFAALETDYYRKPCIRCLEAISDHVGRPITLSKYIGDADGSPGSHSDTDYKFALNLKIPFLDQNKIEGTGVINYPDITGIAEWPPTPTHLTEGNKKVVIMVGCQGSGKSSYVSERLSNFEHVSNDLGNMRSIKKLAKEGKNIVIDNTHPTNESRLKNIPEGYSVTVIHITTPKLVAKHNLYATRINSVTGLTIAQNTFFKKFEEIDIPNSIVIKIENCHKNKELFYYF